MSPFSTTPPKTHPTLGCCGLDCGLCPRYYTKGDSRCPGCQGESFAEKHPSCKILTCCHLKQGMECCGECKQYPCDKIAPWGSADSFISHKVCLDNLAWIKKRGIGPFIDNQRERITLLQRMIDGFDDGRSKNFFCLAATLLPPERIAAAIESAIAASPEKSVQVRHLKTLLRNTAEELHVALALRK